MRHRIGFVFGLGVGLMVAVACNGQDKGPPPPEMAGASGHGSPCTTVLDCEDQDPCTEEACLQGFCVYQPLLLDEDLDGFAARLCGGLDCDDGDGRIHPGAVEGPFEDPSCSDGADNDCNGLTDAQDPDCIHCDSSRDCPEPNPCSVPACQEGRCVYIDAEGPCDDGDPCTEDDRCVLGLCTGSPLDADGDGYVAASCGGSDCDDVRGDIHPGVWEGPPLDSSCTDGLDNDCDGLKDGAEPACQATSKTVELVTDREVANNEADLRVTLTVGTAQRVEQVPISYRGQVRVVLPSEESTLWVEALSLSVDTVSLRIPFPLWDLFVTVEGLELSLPGPVEAPMDSEGNVSMALELHGEGLVSVLLNTETIVEDGPVSIALSSLDVSGRWISQGDPDGDGKEAFDLVVTAPVRYRVEVDDVPLLGAAAVTVEANMVVGLRGEAF